MIRTEINNGFAKDKIGFLLMVRNKFRGFKIFVFEREAGICWWVCEVLLIMKNFRNKEQHK